MNVDERNHLFLTGSIDRDDLWPKIKEYEGRRFQFRWEFGLDILPTEPGVIVIRGPRQSGKSTWLELKLLETIEDFGRGTAFFLNGDYLYSHDEFERKLIELENSFSKKAKVKRIFIDEVTQIKNWERVVKRLIDSGHLRDILIISTGSNAADLRHGAERLPGRKGSLPRTEYLFLPISYREYLYQVKDEIGVFPSDSFWGYILTGGSPLAIHEFYYSERLSDTFTTLISDWILGDLAQSGRSRIFILNILKQLYRVAPSPISFTKLAKEAGLANNSAALDYVERLSDLLCVSPMMQRDVERGVSLARRPSKIPFINLGVAWTFHPRAPRYIHEIKSLEGQARGAMYEWVVAQELWRRRNLSIQRKNQSSQRMIDGEDIAYWLSTDHEIDFVTPEGEFYEVKSGSTAPREFGWFSKIFPKKRLTVISDSEYETDFIVSKTLEKFLMDAPSDLYFEGS